jgi:hypothetical protein
MKQTLQSTENEEALGVGIVSHAQSTYWASPPPARGDGKRKWEDTYSVDDDGGEDGGRNFRPVFGILIAANELRMVVLEEEAEDGQNDDGKYRDDDAVAEGLAASISGAPQPNQPRPAAATYQDQACIAPTIGFILATEDCLPQKTSAETFTKIGVNSSAASRIREA